MLCSGLFFFFFLDKKQKLLLFKKNPIKHIIYKNFTWDFSYDLLNLDLISFRIKWNSSWISRLEFNTEKCYWIIVCIGICNKFSVGRNLPPYETLFGMLVNQVWYDILVLQEQYLPVGFVPPLCITKTCSYKWVCVYFLGENTENQLKNSVQKNPTFNHTYIQ